jgi:TetR/AcrR family transcriptional regulator, transcriptional repressor of aconitase
MNTHLSEKVMTRVTQQHVDARREMILNAAARLFARRGISGATMADIAREADLSAGAIYRYFSSKEELVHAVFDDAIARNQELFQSTAQSAESPLQALQAIGHKVWIELDDHDSLICDIQMALTAAQDPDDFGVELSRTWLALREMLKAMVQQAQASGEIDPDIDPETLAVILQACTAGIQMLKLDKNNQIDVEAAFTLFVDMVVRLSNRSQRVDGR